MSCSQIHYKGPCATPISQALTGLLTMFEAFRRYVSTDLAIDLGTANTLIYVRDREIGRAHV